MMKVFALAFLALFSPTQSKLQSLPEWYRVYTFDDSFIELNTNYVMFNNRHTERVRFRWSFLRSEAPGGEPQVIYQTRLEEIECDCRNKRFCLYNVELFDAGGGMIRSEGADKPGEWREVKFGSMMEKLFTPACQLIERRKREPVVVR
ncbi:MAG: hypothetical protein H0W76_21175 [Pyrinomonadaceae bacterium]|nr:hypothetical protein [Pyrinomonadaceae bacterium]